MKTELPDTGNKTDRINRIDRMGELLTRIFGCGNLWAGNLILVK